MTEFSKTLRFDFPRIPIVGALLLILVLVNFQQTYGYFLDENSHLSFSALSSAVVGLGIMGVASIQLISIALFDLLFPIKKKSGLAGSYRWFRALQDDAFNNERLKDREDAAVVDERRSRDIKLLNHQQIHATLHALEMECREKSPSFGVQLEYYYSLYVFFASVSLAALLFISVQIFDHFVIGQVGFSVYASQIDCVLSVLCFFGAVRARHMKEYLRITLFDHNRKLVLDSLRSWYQCSFSADRSTGVGAGYRNLTRKPFT